MGFFSFFNKDKKSEINEEQKQELNEGLQKSKENFFKKLANFGGIKPLKPSYAAYQDIISLINTVVNSFFDILQYFF